MEQCGSIKAAQHGRNSGRPHSLQPAREGWRLQQQQQQQQKSRRVVAVQEAVLQLLACAQLAWTPQPIQLLRCSMGCTHGLAAAACQLLVRCGSVCVPMLRWLQPGTAGLQPGSSQSDQASLCSCNLHIGCGRCCVRQRRWRLPAVPWHVGREECTQPYQQKDVCVYMGVLLCMICCILVWVDSLKT
jgi:hypothetical protein